MNAIKEEVTLKPQTLRTLFRRLVGLIWSLLLIGYLYLIAIREGLFLRVDTRKTRVTMRLNYVLGMFKPF